MFGTSTRHLRSPLRQFRRYVSDVSEKEKAILDRIIRVDHAGEFGANVIYQGQLAVLGKTPVGPVIQHMWDQEKEHLDTFNKLIPQYRVRPSALLPIWSVAGWALGAGTALLGKFSYFYCYNQGVGRILCFAGCLACQILCNCYNDADVILVSEIAPPGYHLLLLELIS